MTKNYRASFVHLLDSGIGLVYGVTLCVPAIGGKDDTVYSKASRCSLAWSMTAAEWLIRNIVAFTVRT